MKTTMPHPTRNEPSLFDEPQVGCETADGLLNVHPERVSCDVCKDVDYRPALRFQIARDLKALAGLDPSEPEGERRFYQERIEVYRDEHRRLDAALKS
jgi:hypothetical protein